MVRTISPSSTPAAAAAPRRTTGRWAHSPGYGTLQFVCHISSDAPPSYSVKPPRVRDFYTVVHTASTAADDTTNPIITTTAPQPEDFLRSCAYFSFDELVDIALRPDVSDLDDALRVCLRNGVVQYTTFVAGQLGAFKYDQSPLVHRGVFALLCPGVAMTLPEEHLTRGAPKRKRGSCSSKIDAANLDALVIAAHQRAYYDSYGVWIAQTPAAVRELCLLEHAMAEYRIVAESERKNGKPTGRPMSPMSVEGARSAGLQQQQPVGVPQISGSRSCGFMSPA